MLKMLLNKSKSSEEIFLIELLNEKISTKKLDKLYKELNIDLNTLSFDNECILHYCSKKNLYLSVLWLVLNEINLEMENEKKRNSYFLCYSCKK